MAEITISGRKYTLRMDINAMEQIENEFGDLKEALRSFRQDKKVSTVRAMFRILANSGQKRNGQPQDVTGEEIGACNLADLSALSEALNQTMEEAMKAETVGGNEADDTVHDEYLEELEQKEKNA